MNEKAYDVDSSPTEPGPRVAHRIVVAGRQPELDQRLSDELGEFNRAAWPHLGPPRELTVQVLDDAGELAGGLSGWTWGVAAGIEMTWVHEQARAHGVGGLLLSAFESEARERGCGHVSVSSFTFQAPGFYERFGYRELFRREDLPAPGSAGVHLRKEL